MSSAHQGACDVVKKYIDYRAGLLDDQSDFGRISLVCNVSSELGQLAAQDLTRRHIDDLIVKLRAGSLQRPGGRARKAWSARSCNYHQNNSHGRHAGTAHRRGRAD